jgi:type III restriction enzyme
MAEVQLLADKIQQEWDFAIQYGIAQKEVKDYIKSNLNPIFLDRPYQIEAVSKFNFYLNLSKNKPKGSPIHLLFNMATGSGKTVMMAANILELYTKGYRNFIFIVNSTNIIRKTIANFTQKDDPKYLFAPKIIFDFKEININEVENFETVPGEDINILFSTIQGLHGKLDKPKESQITFESLSENKIVILSDEAHHLNVLTKNSKNKGEEEEEKNWESTINKVLAGHSENILLEYTATVDLKHPKILEKYTDKVFVRYSLKEFRNDGFSKEIKLIKGELTHEERILQALILNLYRQKVANNRNIQSPYLPFKAVILFKSSSIAESEQHFERYLTQLKKLNSKQINEIKEVGGSTLKKALSFFEVLGISNQQLCEELKDNFREERCIVINNEKSSEEHQIELNQLEGDKNEYRVIFTVKMLTEGWDVLNLFDIVRLDESKGTKATTLSEAQLIGRGARYFPMSISTGDEMYQRKLDKDLGNTLRCIEELYYHSINDNTYIETITKELEEQGIYSREQEDPIRVKVKEGFKQTSLWEDGFIFTNEKIKKDSKKITSLKQIHESGLQYKFHIGNSSTQELIVFNEEEQKLNKLPKEQNTKNIPWTIENIGVNICLKAMDKIPFYQFEHLNRLLPNLKSKKQFLTDENYVAKVPLTIIANEERIKTLKAKEKLQIAENVLSAIKNDISSKITKYEGSTVFEGKPLKSYLQNDILMMVSVPVDDSKKQYGLPMTGNRVDDFRMNVAEKDWYIYEENYGTSEEKYFVKYLEVVITELKKKYTDIYLLRNEKLFQIFNFSNGAAFEPDFVLFLKEKDTEKKLTYQLFIEPKGDGFTDKDKWKEEFLEQINVKAKIKKIDMLYEDEKFKVVGLPFYNYQTRQKFEDKFKEKLKIK